MKPKRTSTADGYGHAHQWRRKQLKPLVATGTVRCARGALCKFAVGELGGFIRPTDKWDLDHRDDRLGYLGPSHMACNRASAGRKAGKVVSRNWLPA